MGVITIPKSLRDSLGEEASESLAEIIKAVDLDARKDALAIAEERFERRLTEETAKINERITSLESRMMVEIHRSRADIIKWMFIFWLGQIGILSGIVFGHALISLNNQLGPQSPPNLHLISTESPPLRPSPDVL
jgi:hypothetical protein